MGTPPLSVLNEISCLSVNAMAVLATATATNVMTLGAMLPKLET